jgi:hypothetical protein
MPIDYRDPSTYPFTTNDPARERRKNSGVAITVHKNEDDPNFPFLVRLHTKKGIVPLCICESRDFAQAVAWSMDAALRGSLPSMEYALQGFRKHASKEHAWSDWILDEAGV